MDSSAVLILTHNCLGLTKKCIASVMAQDIHTDIGVIDNGSTDGTLEWLSEQDIQTVMFYANLGVSIGWNVGLELAFAAHNSVLVLNNDTELPSYFLRKLLSYDVPFITGISVDEPKDHADSWHQPAEHPDFSAFLIRRDCWETIGRFDEKMKFYAQDLDYHIRAHLKGIHLLNAGVPFHHDRSSTLKLSPVGERRDIEAQANMDRFELKKKWGCNAWDDSYSAMFNPLTFGAGYSEYKEKDA